MSLIDLKRTPSNMYGALMQLQNREERCLKLFQGQIDLVNKTADVMDRLDPDWKDNKRDTDMFVQAMTSYFEDHARQMADIDAAKQNIIASASRTPRAAS